MRTIREVIEARNKGVPYDVTMNSFLVTTAELEAWDDKFETLDDDMNIALDLLHEIALRNPSLMMELTEKLDCHPDGYESACWCLECRLAAQGD